MSMLLLSGHDGSPPRADDLDGKQRLPRLSAWCSHGPHQGGCYSWYPVSSQIQLVSQVFPPSAENACSQWHEVGVSMCNGCVDQFPYSLRISPDPRGHKAVCRMMPRWWSCDASRRASSILATSVPIWLRSCTTVVIPGFNKSAKGMSSKPTSAIENCNSRVLSAATAPIVSVLRAVKRAVGGSGDEKSFSTVAVAACSVRAT